MIQKILFNKYAKQAKLNNIKISKNRQFFIWEFETEKKQKFVGFTPAAVYFGSRTHIWYSLLMNCFLPYSYTINFDNVYGKVCYIMTDAKGIVRYIVPIQQERKKSIPPMKHTEGPIEPGMDDIYGGGPTGEELFE